MANNSVAEPIDEVKGMTPFWQMIRDIRGGTASMRDAGRLYLHQEPAESESDYFNRLSRSVFTNFYKKTINVLVGKPLKDPIVLEEDVPDDIQAMMDNVDLQGSDLNVFARNVLQSAMDDGASHILVDFPAVEQQMEGLFPDGSLTLAQERDGGIRPYAIHIKAQDMLGWKFVVDVNGKKILTQIRFRELVKKDDPEDEFSQTFVERIRVYERGFVRIFERQKEAGGTTGNAGSGGGEDDYVQIAQFTTTLDFIPIITLYTNRVGFLLGEPLLQDFAYLNIAHWQSDSDQRHITHVARVPILFGTGLGTDEDGPSSFTLEIGMGTFTRGPKGSTLEYVEHTGAGVESGQKDLDNLVERMEAMAIAIITKRKPGGITATERVMDEAEAVSDLGLLARELESTLENMLDLFGVWMKKGPDAGGSVTVFKDFGIAIGSEKDLELLRKDRDANDLSLTTYWKEQKRRGLLSDDFNAEQEIDLLDLEGEGGGGKGIETDDEAAFNRVGDTTESSNGHTHVLEDNGWTNSTEGSGGNPHRHRWSAEGTETSEADGHVHGLTRRKAALAELDAEGNGEEDLDDEDDQQQLQPQAVAQN
jgi:hypothetical protein